MPKLFITGNSSGLGLALTDDYLDQGWQVYSLSRRGCPRQHEHLLDTRADLEQINEVPGTLDDLLGKADALDLVILNAGILGAIKDLHLTSQEEIKQVMRINVWANKYIFDWFIANNTIVDQVVMISSGAAIRGHRGWGVYSLSKATFNMLGQIYAHEMPATHFMSLAPGMVQTAMQDYLVDQEKVDQSRYPSVEIMRSAIGTDKMPQPEVVARRIAELIPQLKKYTSGGFVDIRKL